jgi:hypothetical protein
MEWPDSSWLGLTTVVKKWCLSKDCTFKLIHASVDLPVGDVALPRSCGRRDFCFVLGSAARLSALTPFVPLDML